MKKVWKWIIGIVLVGLVLGAIFAVPLAMHTFFAPAFAVRESKGAFVPGNMMRQEQFERFGPGAYPHGGMMGRGQFNSYGPGSYHQGGMMGSYENGGSGCPAYNQGAYPRGGMMGYSNSYPSPMMGFGFSPFGIFRWIIPLAVIGLAVYGVIALIRRRPAATVPAETAPVVSSRSCGSCGKPAMDEWKNCPYCGNSL